jgi:hypothetical protein
VRSEKEELMGDKTIARGSQHRVGFVPLQKSLFRVGNVHTKPIYQYLETNFWQLEEWAKDRPLRNSIGNLNCLLLPLCLFRAC